jgi:hypothetical protein
VLESCTSGAGVGSQTIRLTLRVIEKNCVLDVVVRRAVEMTDDDNPFGHILGISTIIKAQ